MKKTITLLLVLAIVSPLAHQTQTNLLAQTSLTRMHPIQMRPIQTAPFLIQLNRIRIFQNQKTKDLHEAQPLLKSRKYLHWKVSRCNLCCNPTGGLPTPCNQLRAAVSPPDADNKIMVDVYSVSDPEKYAYK